MKNQLIKSLILFAFCVVIQTTVYGFNSVEPSGGDKKDSKNNNKGNDKSDEKFKVTATGKNLVIKPSSQKVVKKTKAKFTVKAKNGYTVSSTVHGSCPKGSWKKDVYQTGQIKKNCNLVFTATQKKELPNPTPPSPTPPSPKVTSLIKVKATNLFVDLMPIGGGSGINFPQEGLQLENGDARDLSVIAADSKYAIAERVEDGCANPGHWATSPKSARGKVGAYVTGVIESPCTITFFAEDYAGVKISNTFEPGITGDGNPIGTRTNTNQTVQTGSIVDMSVYNTSSSCSSAQPKKTGTCPLKSWKWDGRNGIASIGPVTEDCTIVFAPSDSCQ